MIHVEEHFILKLYGSADLARPVIGYLPKNDDEYGFIGTWGMLMANVPSRQGSTSNSILSF